ncbi:MAG: NAD-dependent epimerase/dehydratase family protein [Bacteroidales bacterium]|nr:NAD-dependent epimerase/dehydratase family protein [Bacteroidales bacterium]
MKKRIFLTGATGTMGWAGLQELLKYPEQYDVTILARPSKKNHKKLKPIEDKIHVVWGDLVNYDDVLKGVTGADYVLHVGGMVSPKADYYPEKTLRVNVKAAENVVKAVLAQANRDDMRVVYIGSVAETSDRNEPIHWGRCGDPVFASNFDYYAVSKIAAERIFADSGIRHWVSLRQSGILYPAILKNFDPIMFHVPIRGVLEWATVEDSGRLLERVCRDNVPNSFWNRFYNISSGPQYRMTNYDFETRVLKAVHCPRPEKIFNANWFVLKNFHGHYYLDADKLEEILHFRANIPLDDYFKQLGAGLPGIFRMAKIVPPFIIKAALCQLANKKTYGTQYWISHNDTARISAYYGSLEEWRAIPKWSDWDLSEPADADKAVQIQHGYDETKSLAQLTLAELQAAAAFRGGRLVSDEYSGDPSQILEWECHNGHRFKASPKLVLEGGHWCPDCLSNHWDNFSDVAKHNPFFAQVYKN